MDDLQIYEIRRLGNGLPGFEHGSGFFRVNVCLPEVPFKEHIGQRFAILPAGFDPEDHDLIAVDNDARVIWLENDADGGQGFHLQTPYKSSVGWISQHFHSLGLDVVQDLKDSALVKFLAVSVDKSLCPKEPEPEPTAAKSPCDAPWAYQSDVSWSPIVA